ncbi:MAG: Ig-like domain-containing protein, partial [Gemmatimonadales bacterium]|nr:Ig-like domain-containing protein [Gemmatimonadales bacterium]
MWVGLRRLLVIAGAVAVAACPDQLTDSGYVITVSPAAATLFVEDSVRFTATVFDDGNPVTEPPPLTWSVSDPSVASVDDAGWVRARGPGSALVGVSASGATATATVTVAVDDGRTLAITPTTARVPVNSVVRFTAALLDRHGDTIPTAPTWSSTNPAVATVDGEGRARGVATGSVTIRAAAGGLTAESPLTVEPRAESAVLVGAGDIASCDNSGDERTADLLDDIPGIVFTAGDNAYPNGTAAEFADCYHPSWGRHQARTRPAAGNHEYHSFGAAP